MPRYDARKALRDPNPRPRPTAPLLPPVRLDVDRLAGRAAAALGAYQLLDHLEERHEPAEVDAAVERFVEALRSRLGG